MTLGKIYNMNIISDTCSVRCIIVITEYTKTRKLSYRYLCYIRKQVVWNTLGSSPISPLLCAPIGLK